MPNNKPIQLQTYLRLIAIGIDPERDTPELYYLHLEGIKDKPVMDSEFIIFFPDPQQARLIAENLLIIKESIRLTLSSHLWCVI